LNSMLCYNFSIGELLLFDGNAQTAEI